MHKRQKKIKLTFMIETWLKNEDFDWMKSSEFYKDPLRISNFHRDGRRGGGIALVYKKDIQVDMVKMVI